MIKKIRTIFEKYMIRPMLYQCATKVSIALVLCLLWDRFINREQYYSLVEFAFFVAGAFFLALAWFQYLRLDGARIHHLMEEKQEKKKRNNILPKTLLTLQMKRLFLLVSCLMRSELCADFWGIYSAQCCF